MRTVCLVSLAAVVSCSDSGPALDADYVAWGTSGSTVTVGWLPIDGATAFVIERGTSEADLAPVATLAPPETSYLDTGLAPLTTYVYRFSYTATDGTVVVEPVEQARTTDEEILVTGEPTPLGAPVVATVGAAGAAIAVDAVHATVIVPPGAVADGTDVTVQPIASPYPDDDSPGVTIAASAPVTQPIDLVFAYDDVDALAPDNLAIAVQADDGSWISQPRVIDPVAGTVTFQFPATAARASQVNFHGAFMLRSTFVLPRKVSVNVRQTQRLYPWGIFSDSPFDSGDDGLPGLTTAALIAMKRLNLQDFRRPARREIKLLPNNAPGYERTWTVENVINGNAVYGLMSTPAEQGAIYSAPAARPSTVSGFVTVRFTSVLVADDLRLPATPTPALITVVDPGSFHVAADLRLDATAIPCPLGSVNLTDHFDFAVTRDPQGQLSVDAIANQATMLGELVFPIGFTGGWDTMPEAMTATGGEAYEDPETHQITVNVIGTGVAGVCHRTDGSTTLTRPGQSLWQTLSVTFDQNGNVTVMDPSWTATVTGGL